MPIRNMRIRIEDVVGDEPFFTRDFEVETGKTLVIGVTPIEHKGKTRFVEVKVLEESQRCLCRYKKRLP